MNQLTLSGESAGVDHETLRLLVEVKAMDVVRNLHLLRYPNKYAAWHLVKVETDLGQGNRVGEWYQSFDAMYLDPRISLAQKSGFLTDTLSYVRVKSGKTDPKDLRHYVIQHGGLPEDWAGTADYRDERLQPMTIEDILPPEEVWQQMCRGAKVRPEPLLAWLEGVAANLDDFDPLPDRPPNVIIPQEGHIFEILGGVIAQQIEI